MCDCRRERHKQLINQQGEQAVDTDRWGGEGGDVLPLSAQLDDAGRTPAPRTHRCPLPSPPVCVLSAHLYVCLGLGRGSVGGAGT